ncbi:NUDIX domain-containing protein [Flavobacterium silvaticum]|uniref:GDP-mannose pyrophosphatase n=1 Tax=Flavobacterium silvaticum TaxID=1852020 RepID=A0A972FL19_9FLAO|nr:NUDIX domain-containing protein [Flavobacterium silvaticum]NMH27931.1 NUDIX domain-containing protein [Flavobacterium silvaticum]
MKDPKITIERSDLLSDNHYILKKYRFKYELGDINETQTREVYDRGNGASVLLYNRDYNSVILIRQFRLPTYLNGNKSGMLIEACAGLMDEDDPAKTVIREAEEETGYHIDKVTKAYECYMSPGAVTEILYLFVAEYTKEMKQSAGGGLDAEHEHIDIIEMPFDEAMAKIASGEICDAKTVMLLQYLKLNGLMD